MTLGPTPEGSAVTRLVIGAAGLGFVALIVIATLLVKLP